MSFTQGQSVKLTVTLGLNLPGTLATVVGGDDSWGYLITIAGGVILYVPLSSVVAS